MFTLFYTFLLIYTCLLFLHAEKSNKRWNSNVFAYTLHLFLSLEGRAPSKILPNRWNHWDSLHFSSSRKCSGVNVYASATMAMLPGRTIR